MSRFGEGEPDGSDEGWLIRCAFMLWVVPHAVCRVEAVVLQMSQQMGGLQGGGGERGESPVAVAGGGGTRAYMYPGQRFRWGIVQGCHWRAEVM